MSDRVEVGPASALAPGDRRIVEAGPMSIGVFNVGGEYHALLNTCQHQHGPVCEGALIPEIEAEYRSAGERVEETVTEEDALIRCPWHGWTYDVATGVHSGDGDIRLPTFDVVEEDGVLFVEV